jgi:hypothetical protein
MGGGGVGPEDDESLMKELELRMRSSAERGETRLFL